MTAFFLLSACIQPSAGPAATPTYHQDVAPILAANCEECHSPGGIAPSPLTTYEETAAYASAIARAVTDRIMPPFNLDNSGDCNTFLDARWLTDDEIATIRAWAEGGTPEGEPPAEPPEVPAPWALDRVDLTLAMPEPYTPSTAAMDDYRCFILDPGLTEDQFLTGFQVRLGEAREVHHLTLFAFDTEEDEKQAEALDAAEPGPGYTCFGDTIAPSRWLIGSGPGIPGGEFPDETGARMHAGRKTVLQMHYNRANGTFPDQTAVDLRLEPSIPHEAYVERVAASELLLPSGRPHVEATNTVRLWSDYRVWGVWPHMHDLGRTLEVDAIGPTGARCLARVDNYQFHWQGFAFYTHPLWLRTGEKLRITCSYDTTSRDTLTTWGSGTADEMCIGFFYETEEP